MPRAAREKMARGVIGAEVFQEKIEKKVMEVRRPKRGRPKNILHLFVIDNESKNHPQDSSHLWKTSIPLGKT
jgi:hypothetical protein